MLSGVIDDLDVPAKLNVAAQAASSEASKVLSETAGRFVVVTLDPESGRMTYASNADNDTTSRMLREAAEAIEQRAVEPVAFIPFLSRRTAGD